TATVVHARYQAPSHQAIWGLFDLVLFARESSGDRLPSTERLIEAFDSLADSEPLAAAVFAIAADAVELASLAGREVPEDFPEAAAVRLALFNALPELLDPDE